MSALRSLLAPHACVRALATTRTTLAIPATMRRASDLAGSGSSNTETPTAAAESHDGTNASSAASLPNHAASLINEHGVILVNSLPIPSLPDDSYTVFEQAMIEIYGPDKWLTHVKSLGMSNYVNQVVVNRAKRGLLAAMIPEGFESRRTDNDKEVQRAKVDDCKRMILDGSWKAEGVRLRESRNRAGKRKAAEEK